MYMISTHTEEDIHILMDWIVKSFTAFGSLFISC